MAYRHPLSAIRWLCLSATWVCSTPTQAATCTELDLAATQAGAIVPGHASGYTVSGPGRLQFFSAPTKTCKMHGVFIVPGDKVTMYRVHGGFASIRYMNLKAGTDASGWVELKRLKSNGTGISPKQ